MARAWTVWWYMIKCQTKEMQLVPKKLEFLGVCWTLNEGGETGCFCEGEMWSRGGKHLECSEEDLRNPLDWYELIPHSEVWPGGWTDETILELKADFFFFRIHLEGSDLEKEGKGLTSMNVSRVFVWIWTSHWPRGCSSTLSGFISPLQAPFSTSQENVFFFKNQF